MNQSQTMESALYIKKSKKPPRRWSTLDISGSTSGGNKVKAVVHDTEAVSALKEHTAKPSHQHDMNRLLRHAKGHEEYPDAQEKGGLSVYEDDLRERLGRAVFVGHINTDLDSVAGAIGAAALFGGTPALAEPLDQINGEISFALKNCGIEPPLYFPDIPGCDTCDVCLVDHSEEKQMVRSVREAPQRIVGLVDHHALAKSFHTARPIYMDVRPWGSMSTIVGYLFVSHRRALTKPLATLLLQAILSDTLNLRSVTTTDADRSMVALLTSYGGLGKLSLHATSPTDKVVGLYQDADIDLLAKKQFQAKTNWIVALGPYEMVRGDQKDFSCGPWKFGIGVLEVTDTDGVMRCAREILTELRLLKKEKGLVVEQPMTSTKGDEETSLDPNTSASVAPKMDRTMELDFAFLFVVNVVDETSILLISGGRELALAKAAFLENEEINPPYTDRVTLGEAAPGIAAPGCTIRPDETAMFLPKGYVSRKAQFVPAFFQALQDDFEYQDRLPMSLHDDEEESDDELGALELQDKLNMSRTALTRPKRRQSSLRASFHTNAMELLISRELTLDDELVRAHQGKIEARQGDLYDSVGHIVRTYDL